MADQLCEILERCRRGDGEAVRLLVVRFRDGALDLARCLLSDEHLAEDAVQEAFLKALDRLGDLRDPAAFPGWFRQIVRTQCHRILRRQREPVVCVDANGVVDPGSPEAGVVGEELRSLVRCAMSELPAKQREAVELFYLDDRPCGEIAAMLGVPSGTVRRRLHEARRRLRDALFDYVTEPKAPNRRLARRPDLRL
ncbi:MAG: sigma-70 family RNA polymerase sigma factor [Phycisphaerae bacterium]|nr:sigma-70 family RNA polymerase sigma factor [Phycisphaerae bacterium]